MLTKNKRIIGLVPAAGQATRLSPLPFSKELYPIGHIRFKDVDDLRPKPVCIYLLEKMKAAGITDVYIVLRKGKWDIPAYLGDGSVLDMNFAYLIMDLPFGVPFTLDQAYSFVKDSIVAFGFPDIIFDRGDAFTKLLNRLSKTKADAVIGAFRVSQSNKWDMIKIEPGGDVSEVYIKKKKNRLKYTWINAVWTPNFTSFLHNYVSNIRTTLLGERTVISGNFDKKEFFFSQVIGEAIKNGMSIQSVIFQDSKCIDIGTSVDLATAIDRHNTIVLSSEFCDYTND